MLRHSIPQFDSYQICASLFTDVENTRELRTEVASMPFAMIDASCIGSLEQLFCAVYKAILESTYNRLRTKNLNSECILSLSPTSNIGEAFKRFGIKEDSKDILCLTVVNNTESIPDTLFDDVKGQQIELSDENLESRINLDLIKKVR
ncbi:LANO_0H11804g1_1 [Lachancea nothofagi CBS 11611]|uniref:EKC/KEOPS complex subunit CGI121 n=1 Tax=Lachancea nothofagi CBS 11611 TaxID=1266666 RepID=A0A1G4KMC6_9SACH|nr:LANO_0H11804g1_1 [Lachancea nothofagi CBS 11611]